MQALEEMKDKRSAQEFYRRVVLVIAKIEGIAKKRQSNLTNNQKDDALLVCLSQIKKNVVAMGMILNSYLNTCFAENSMAMSEEKFKEVYCLSSVVKDLPDDGFEPLKFLLMHGSHVCLCFHVDNLFNCLLESLPHITATLLSKQKKNLFQNLPKRAKVVLNDLLSSSQCWDKIEPFFTIRNSYHNNGNFDRKEAKPKLSIFIIKDFICWIENILNMIEQICLSSSIEKPLRK